MSHHCQRRHSLAQRAQDHLGRVLGDRVLLVKHVELGRRILATPDEQDLLAARVLVQKRGHIQHLAIDYDLYRSARKSRDDK